MGSGGGGRKARGSGFLCVASTTNKGDTILWALRLSTGLYLGLTANRCAATPQEPEMKVSHFLAW